MDARQTLRACRVFLTQCIAQNDEGEFAAHCICWYDSRTNYAYVEPVCTIPQCRRMGLGSGTMPGG